jgi:hypothetical protein
VAVGENGGLASVVSFARRDEANTAVLMDVAVRARGSAAVITSRASHHRLVAAWATANGVRARGHDWGSAACAM